MTRTRAGIAAEANADEGAPGKTPFVATVELNREGRPGENAPEPRRRVSKRGDRRLGQGHLEPGTLVLSDALGCFRAVQRAGCFHQPFVTGGGPASAQHPALSWVNTILGNIKRSLHGSYHHISSKHLQRYLAKFSYRFNRRFSFHEMSPRLAYVALRTPPMSNRVLKLAENYAQFRIRALSQTDNLQDHGSPFSGTVEKDPHDFTLEATKENQQDEQ